MKISWVSRQLMDAEINARKSCETDTVGRLVNDAFYTLWLYRTNGISTFILKGKKSVFGPYGGPAVNTSDGSYMSK